MDKAPDIYDDEVDLFKYWEVVRRRRKLIGAITGVALVISVVVSLVLPKVYMSSASLLPPQNDGQMPSSLLAQLPQGLSSVAGGLMGTRSASGVWIGILKSQSVEDSVIERLDLRAHYKTNTIEDTREALERAVKIEKSKDDIITIMAYDKDPAFTVKLVGAMLDELDRVNMGIVTTSGKRTRLFIEKRLDESRMELAKKEEEAKAFQEKNRAIKLDDQSRATIDALGRIKGQLMAKEVELQTLLSYATEANPQVQLLRTQISELKARLREIEEGSSGQKDSFIPSSRMPALGLQYVRILREVKANETLYQLLMQQYEMARIQEAKDSPTIQVLDSPKLPEKHAKPKKRAIVAGSTVGAFVFAVFLAFLLEYVKGYEKRLPEIRS